MSSFDDAAESMAKAGLTPEEVFADQNKSYRKECQQDTEALGKLLTLAEKKLTTRNDRKIIVAAKLALSRRRLA